MGVQDEVLCFVTKFTIASCTVPMINYHSERMKVFGGFYMVR